MFHFGSLVDAHFICKRVPGRLARRRALNDLITHSFASARTHAAKKSPTPSLFQTDGKRADRLSSRGRAARHYVGMLLLVLHVGFSEYRVFNFVYFPLFSRTSTVNGTV